MTEDRNAAGRRVTAGWPSLDLRQPVTGLRDVANDCDVLLCDVFGTIHDGRIVFPAAVEALHRFKNEGGTVVLVSNTAAAGDVLADTLSGLGLFRHCYDAIVTSADLARTLIDDRGVRLIHHIGPDSDKIVLRGLDVRLCPIPDAELILCTGYSDEVFKSEYLSLAAARGLDLICTNPDREVVVGTKTLRFAGLVADQYRVIGGRVLTTGKPDPSIYKAALITAAEFRGESTEPNRVVAVGDSFSIDIAGALALEIAALWISDVEPARVDSARIRRLPALIW